MNEKEGEREMNEEFSLQGNFYYDPFIHSMVPLSDDDPRAQPLTTLRQLHSAHLSMKILERSGTQLILQEEGYLRIICLEWVADKDVINIFFIHPNQPQCVAADCRI